MEDEVQMADRVREVCEDSVVPVAVDVHDAVLLLERGPPDLVLSDVMMPHVDGRALCRTMHAHPVSCAIPIILMRVGRATLVHDVPHTAFLSKPVSVERLLSTIAQHLPAP